MSSDPAPLIGALEEQASQERDRLVAEARVRAGAILSAADEEIERIRAQALRGLDKELVVERQRVLGEATMRARTERLRLKRRLLGEAFGQARQEITRRAGLPGAETALAKLAAEAASAVGGPCDTRVEKGIVTATSKDGRKSADNSLEARLARAEKSLEIEAARMLGLSTAFRAVAEARPGASQAGPQSLAPSASERG